MSGARRSRSLLHPFRGARGEAERLHLLLSAQQATSQSREVEDVLGRALEHALRFTGHQAGAGLLQTPGGERVLVRCVAGDIGRSGVDRLAQGTVARGAVRSLYDLAITERRPLQQLVPRTPPGSEQSAASRGAPAHPSAYLILPLITPRQQVLGALFLSSATYQPPLAPEDVEVLQALASQVAPAVEST
ncbi:MAG TPA: GAF domain-containing protein, partial [Chloroflexota bacterium]|nr:GAF domain-containing protein [Chloroflexota bacterium]